MDPMGYGNLFINGHIPYVLSHPITSPSIGGKRENPKTRRFFLLSIQKGYSEVYWHLLDRIFMGLFQQLDLNINFNGDFHIYIYIIIFGYIIEIFQRGSLNFGCFSWLIPTAEKRPRATNRPSRFEVVGGAGGELLMLHESWGLPSGKRLHSYGKWTICSWFTHKKGWFCIAMLVYQRVNYD